MPRKTIEFVWPSGVVRRQPLRATPQGSSWPSPWALNTRLVDNHGRVRGGSFVGPSPDEVDEPRFPVLVTENGDRIVTEDGDQIVLGPQYGVASGYGRVWVAPGEGAPAAGSADCLYRDRLFRTADHIILCSRQGKLDDWDYGAVVDDPGRAMAFQLSEAGEIGTDVVALVPDRDAHLVCFTDSETWVCTGDPTTGTLRNISREVGIIAPRAWCKWLATVFFLSKDGLYSVQANGSELRALSAGVVPEELSGITDPDCVLAYSHSDKGVYIHLSEGPSWFYHVESNQFWPFDLSATDSHVLIGPFEMGHQNTYGRAIHLHGNIIADSEPVVWRLVTGDTAAEAADKGKAAIEAAVAGNDFSAYVSAQGTWESGRAHMAYPRTRAIWCCLWLSSTVEWSFEAASMVATVSGDWR